MLSKAFILLLIGLSTFETVRTHIGNIDCRPCEQGWKQNAACDPAAHSTMCEECMSSSAGDTAELSSAQYTQYCRPWENKCDATCPEDQFIWSPCAQNAAPPVFVTCSYCNSTRVQPSDKLKPDYLAKCVQTTTTPKVSLAFTSVLVPARFFTYTLWF